MKRRLRAAICILTLSCSAVFADPVRFFEAGRALQRAGNWYSAIESYQESLRLNPNYAPVYQSLAECFWALSEYDQALEYVRRARGFRRTDPELMNLEGRILIALGRLDDAQALFNAVLVSWPNDISARFGSAEIDVAAGRVTQASGRYQEALTREPENRRALLSLAVVSRELGNTAAARDYIQRALRFHGDDPQVFYFAAWLSVQDGAWNEAEGRLRSALRLNPDYDAARELLSTVLYRTGRYTEVLEMSDNRIGGERNRRSAWYMRTLALDRLGRHDEALASARTGLQIDPNDEVFRAYAERIILDKLSLEDSRRPAWAAWHSDKARSFEGANLSDQAVQSWRRSLKINPYGTPERLAYANLLLARGYPSRYLEQLKFIQSLGKGTVQINDAVEAWQKLLMSSLQNRWKIDPLFLNKAHLSVGFYYQEDPGNSMHPESERITTVLLAETLSWNARFSVRAQELPVSSYSEAFRASRQAGEQWFVLVRFRENERDVEIRMDLYLSATGSKVDSFTVFRTGNDRYANALRRSAQIVSSALPLRGTILSRFQQDALIDLGKSDAITAGMVFDIVPGSAITVGGNGLSWEYRSEAVLGTLTVKETDEDTSLATIARSGFFDRINPGDAVIPRIEKDTRPDPARVEPQNPPPALLGLLRRMN